MPSSIPTSEPAAAGWRSDPHASVGQVLEQWHGLGEPLPAARVTSRVWRQGEGEPVLCLHGVPASAFLYRKLLPALAQQGLQGIAFDLPGMGFSDKPKKFDYSWSGLSAWCEQALDALGLESTHLLVHDIGGPIGFDLIRRCSPRIRSLTVLNTMIHVARFRRPWSMEPFARRGLGELCLACTTPRLFEVLMRLQGVATDVPAAELHAYAHLLKRADGGRAFLRIMRSFERTEPFEQGILDALRQRQFPAQVIWGSEDPALKEAIYAPMVRDALDVPAHQSVPGKHFVQEDSPAEIAAAVASLVAATAGNS